MGRKPGAAVLPSVAAAADKGPTGSTHTGPVFDWKTSRWRRHHGGILISCSHLLVGFRGRFSGWGGHVDLRSIIIIFFLLASDFHGAARNRWCRVGFYWYALDNWDAVLHHARERGEPKAASSAALFPV